jgi:hypothetical protein
MDFLRLDLDYYRLYAQADPGRHYSSGTTSVGLPQDANDVLMVENLHGKTIDIRSDSRGAIPSILPKPWNQRNPNARSAQG